MPTFGISIKVPVDAEVRHTKDSDRLPQTPVIRSKRIPLGARTNRNVDTIRSRRPLERGNANTRLATPRCGPEY